MVDIKIMQDLINKLNEYRNAYYNMNISMISDEEYDRFYDELVKMEQETGIAMSDSPTRTVGYKVVSNLKKITHSHPMLSLDKTQNIDELSKFIGEHDCLLMYKMDGLTVLLTYEDGVLIRAETRGNGIEGEIITHNAKVFINIPLTIPYKEHYEIEGEAVITFDDFSEINKNLPDNEKYKNPRNLVSGSVRQLNSEIAAQRRIRFVAWKVITDTGALMSIRLNHADSMGFTTVPRYLTNGIVSESSINLFKGANYSHYPIDGLVCSYDDIHYGVSLGQTSHHPKHSIAYKFYDNVVETTLKGIRWTVGKTGVITPTAIFKPVEIDGTTISKASLSNLNIMTSLGISNSGQTIGVYKAHQIIPQISYALPIKQNGCVSSSFIPPKHCPECFAPIVANCDEIGTKNLYCTNKNCSGVWIKKFAHFASRDAMRIDGFAESTIRLLVKYDIIHKPLLTNNFSDIYNIHKYKRRLLSYQGLGEQKIENLLSAIEKSRHNVKLHRFIYALSIPLVGKSASKVIASYFNNNHETFFNMIEKIFFEQVGFTWTVLEGIGDELSNNLNQYFMDAQNYNDLCKLMKILDFEDNNVPIINILSNKTFCITGTLKMYSNRQKLIEAIELLGGKVVSSVSKNTNYLIANDKNSGSSKNKKASQLKIPIISEEEFEKMTSIHISN